MSSDKKELRKSRAITQGLGKEAVANQIRMETPEKLNELLNEVLSGTAMEQPQQLNARITAIMTEIRNAPNLDEINPLHFENLKILAKKDEQYRTAIFNEFKKPEYREKVSGVLIEFARHGVVSPKSDKEALTALASSELPHNVDKAVGVIMQYDALMQRSVKKEDIKYEIAKLAKMSDFPEFKPVLIACMMNKDYAKAHDDIFSEKMISLVDNDSLDWNFQEVDQLVKHVANNDSFYSYMTIDRFNEIKVSKRELEREASMSSGEENSSAGASESAGDAPKRELEREASMSSGEENSSVGASESASDNPLDQKLEAAQTKTWRDVGRKFLRNFAGFGMAQDKYTSRWQAVTGNIFEDPKLTLGGLMLPVAEKLEIIRLSDDKKNITDVNWSRALNPFVLANYGLYAAELGIKRIGSALFGKYDTARAIFQAPFVAILRVAGFVLDVLGRATSVPGVPDKFGDAVKRENKAVKNYKEKMQNFDFEKHANTQRAINNFMYTHRKEGSYKNVRTEFDGEIAKTLVARNNNNKSSRTTAISVMALRNTLVEFESKRIKTSADKIAIESIRKNLASAIEELKKDLAKEPDQEEAKVETSQVGEKDMTDTAEVRQQVEEVAEVASLNIQDAKPAAYEPSSGDEAESASDSPREAEALLGAEKEAPTTLFGRLREAVAGFFGGGKEGAEAKAVAVAGAAGGTKLAAYEYNQVVLNGVGEQFGKSGMQEKLGAWIENQQANLGAPLGNSTKLPIEFAGGQRIEVSGKDVVMKGFSAEAYRSFRDNILKGKNSIPSFSVSAADRSAYAKVAGAIQKGKASKTFSSRLTSVSLFFQRAVNAVASFLGIAKVPPQSPVAAKSTGTSAMLSELSSPKTSPVTKPSPKVEPAPAQSHAQAKAQEPQAPNAKSQTEQARTPQPVQPEPPAQLAKTAPPTLDTPPQSPRAESASRSSGRPVIPQAMRERLAVTVIIQGHDTSAVEKSVKDVVADFNHGSQDLSLATERSEGMIQAKIQTPDNAIIEVSCNKASDQVELKVSPSTEKACEVVAAMVKKLPEAGSHKTVAVESQGEHGKALIEALKQEGHTVSHNRDDLKQPQIQSPRASSHE